MKDAIKENITSPEFKLHSLQEQLRNVPKGSQEHNRIRDEIDVIGQSMDAHRELFERLLNAHDVERIHAILETKIIAEQRFDADLLRLLELDLTFPETIRLGKLISKQSREIESRLAIRHESHSSGRKTPD
jgi:hypothetical protein